MTANGSPFSYLFTLKGDFKMSVKILEVRHQRKALVEKMRKVHETAEADSSRAMTAEEETEFNKLNTDQKALGIKIERMETLDAIASDYGDLEDRANTGDLGKTGKKGENNTLENRTSEKYTEVFNRFLTGGVSNISLDEKRALQSDDDQGGGYLVPPENFVNQLLKDLDDEVFLLREARVFTQKKARSLGVPKRAAKMNVFAWGGEVKAAPKDSALKFGKRVLEPHYLTGEILVSRDLVRSSSVGIDTLVREEMATNAGEVQEDAYLTGNGAQQPLGIFTASADGISTGRDFGASSNTSTQLRFNGLFDAKYGLKAGYRRRAKWLFHRDAVAQLAKLQDSDGQYIWHVSVRDGEPDRLMGLPFLESERAPSTFTASLYVGMLADFKAGYWIVRTLEMEIQRLVEVYAETNQFAYIGRLKADGAPVLEEAFARVILAA
jgi:HK97 family phage major capsid protein